MFIAEAPSISVLIIVKDEPSIEKSLESLEIQCKEMNAECIVVDASENRLDSIKAKFPWVCWIDYKQPCGQKITIPQQRNIAVATARSSVLLFCDAGGTPSSSWVRELSTPLLEGMQHLVGGPILYTNKSASTISENLQKEGEVLRVSTTANIGFTRSAFYLVKGFNEDLNYGSDADFIWKLEAQGIKHVCISSAVMGLDGGSTRRELKRNWLYGRAIVTLFGLHQDKWKEKFRSNAEIWVYPLLIMMWIGALILVLKLPLLILLPLIMTCILIFKNIKEQHPLRIIFRHYVYSAGSIYQIIFGKWRHIKLSPILIFPPGKDRYTLELKGAINRCNSPLDYFPRLGPSATLTILLMPLYSFILKVRGVRIVHIHWLYSFNLHWCKGKISRSFIQNWLRLWIISLKICRIRIIYTVHNIIPHEIIFRNDKATFKYLERSADILILLNEVSFKNYSQSYYEKDIALIPEGPINLNTTYSRKSMNELLNITNRRLIILVGNLSAYKQADLLLNQSIYMPSNFALRIAGNAANKNYIETLDKELSDAKLHGVDADIQFGYLTENEFGGYLSVADYFCVPFKEVNNSGSINSALCAGVPVIVPNIDSLDWVPSGARLNINYNSDGHLDFKQLLQSLGQISFSEHESMREAAVDWASTLSWEDVAKQHIELYKNLGGSNE